MAFDSLGSKRIALLTRFDGAPELQKLVTYPWVELLGHPKRHARGTDQLLHIREILQPMCCNHTGGELQLDPTLDGKQSERFTSDRRRRGIRKCDRLGLVVAREPPGAQDVDVNVELRVDVLSRTDDSLGIAA